MPSAPKLEVFETYVPPDEAVWHGDTDELEDIRKGAYETGYAAGWQDAQDERQSAEALRRTSAEEALRALHFTHHEAREHLLGALQPLLRTMVEIVLPDLARATLGATVAEQIAALSGGSLSAPVELLCNEAAARSIRPLLETITDFDLRLIEEPSLTDGQVILRLDPARAEIDLNAAVATARATVAAFGETFMENSPMERKAHG